MARELCSYMFCLDLSCTDMWDSVRFYSTNHFVDTEAETRCRSNAVLRKSKQISEIISLNYIYLLSNSLTRMKFLEFVMWIILCWADIQFILYKHTSIVSNIAVYDIKTYKDKRVGKVCHIWIKCRICNILCCVYNSMIRSLQRENIIQYNIIIDHNTSWNFRIHNFHIKIE